jgi:hypothetical protein
VDKCLEAAEAAGGMAQVQRYRLRGLHSSWVCAGHPEQRQSVIVYQAGPSASGKPRGNQLVKSEHFTQLTTGT